MLSCDFLYSYLVYSHKKQNIICFITRCTQRARATVKKSPRTVPASLHIPQTNEKKAKKNNNNNNGGGKNSRLSSSFCDQITFLWCRSLEFEQKVYHGRQGGEMRLRSPVVSAAFTAASSCLESSSTDARLATKPTL